LTPDRKPEALDDDPLAPDHDPASSDANPLTANVNPAAWDCHPPAQDHNPAWQSGFSLALFSMSYAETCQKRTEKHERAGWVARRSPQCGVVSGLWPETWGFVKVMSRHSLDATSFAEVSFRIDLVWRRHPA